MITIYYQDNVRKIKKDEIACISKTGKNVFISLKSGYGHYVKNNLEDVVEIVELYGKHELIGVENGKKVL